MVYLCEDEPNNYKDTSGLSPSQSLSNIACLTTVTRYHDDVIKWTQFPRCWPFVRGIHRSPVVSRHKGQWRGALMFYLIGAWTNGWTNNRDAGDLRRHGTPCDVIVMCMSRDSTIVSVESVWRLLMAWCLCGATTSASIMMRETGRSIPRPSWPSKVWYSGLVSIWHQDICINHGDLDRSVHWHHNERAVISNHQCLDCLLNRSFRQRWKKTSKLRALACVRGIHRWPVNSPHKGPITEKMFPFHDVIMVYLYQERTLSSLDQIRRMVFFYLRHMILQGTISVLE